MYLYLKKKSLITIFYAEIQQIRLNKKQLAEKLLKRKADFSKELNEAFRIDELKRNTQQKLDDNKASLNKLSAEIGKLFKEGNHKLANEIKSETVVLKAKIKKLKDDFGQLEIQLNEVLYQIPNIPNDLVPQVSETDNEVIYESEFTKPEVNLLPHWELAKKYNLIDFELGVKITGAGFPVYMGKGAILQRALIQFFLNQANKAGFEEFLVPHVVNENSGFGTGQLPDKEGQMYHITEDNLYLIPTAEVPITNVYRNDLLSHDDLPIKYVGYTPCFRREAGSYGKDVRGLNRLYQFDKVKIVQQYLKKKAIKH